jgi:hypothetical protein
MTKRNKEREKKLLKKKKSLAYFGIPLKKERENIYIYFFNANSNNE